MPPARLLLWRPVLAGWGTLQEVGEQWSMDDLCEAHLLLNAKAEAEADALDAARAASSRDR